MESFSAACPLLRNLSSGSRVTLCQMLTVSTAVNAATGHLDWESLVQGAPVNARTRSFDPLTERQRASLLLMNGMVYVAFASYCDFTPYTGLVAAVNTSSHAVSLWTDEAAPSGKQAGIWMSDGGLMSDGSGRIFATSGNGVCPCR